MGNNVSSETPSLLGRVPSVDSMLKKARIIGLLDNQPRYFVAKAIRHVLDELRMQIREGQQDGFSLPSEEALMDRMEAKVREYTAPGIRRVINATGIILHTGMGRAVLSKSAVLALQSMEGFVNVQADIHSGKRSQRDFHAERLLCELTGAEAAFVVNNNAAATMIVLNTLAEGREVIVSRGQLIEIGGSFRLPDVMAKSGVIMKEVGTTNRTHLRDYEQAVNERTGCIFRAHHSNYRIEGFTHEPEVGELADLGRKLGVPVVDDLGAGAFIDLSSRGFQNEPMVQRSLKAGADLVFFSGDKLVGGPQAGIIVGKKEYIRKIRSNPLARVMRVCKLTLVALEATLLLHFDEEKLFRENPLYLLLARDLESIDLRARMLAEQLAEMAPAFAFAVVDEVSYMGSGSLPMEDIKTRVIAVDPGDMDCECLGRLLRERDIPVYSRIRENRIMLDMRTVLDGEEPCILQAFADIQKNLDNQKCRGAKSADPVVRGLLSE